MILRSKGLQSVAVALGTGCQRAEEAPLVDSDSKKEDK